ISVGSRHMSSIDAMGAIDDLAAAKSFYETFKSTRAPFSGGTSITVPVTIAFGDRDLILPNWSRSRQALPAHTRWVEKRGWGHVPLWVDSAGVAELILEGTG